MLRLSRYFVAALVLSGWAAHGQDKSRQYTNPVGDKSLRLGAPFVLQHNEKYYLFGNSPDQEGFQVYESDNLVNWKPKGWAYRKPRGSWAEGGFQSPEVKLYHDRFYMVYSARVKGSKPPRMLLGLAVSEWPVGPYYDVQSKPWFDPGFSIGDGHLFTEDDGSPYLFFTRRGEKDGYNFGTIYGTRMGIDLGKPSGATVQLLDAGQPWETAEGTRTRCDEAPAVLKHDGRYYLIYSANDSRTPGYAVGYAVAPTSLGPFTKAAENPILASNPELKVFGPGHGSVTKSPDANELFYVYQTLTAGAEDAKKPVPDTAVNLDRIVWDSQGKLAIKGPTRSPQPLPSGAPGK